MDNEKAFERAKSAYGTGAYDDATLEFLFPQLRESEDERIRKLLVWQVYRNIEDETNDLAGSVYDGIKGHDPDLEESIEDWKKCLAWLEKKKETEKEVSELFDCTDSYNKGYRAGQEKALQELKNHIKEDKTQCYAYDAGYASGFIVGKEQGWKERGKYEKQKEQKPWKVGANAYFTPEQKPEWSEEDEAMRDNILRVLSCYVGPVECESNPYLSSSYFTYRREIGWLKSLRPRPQWKPSEEQMKALKRCVDGWTDDGDGTLDSLYNDLKKLM